jgi:Transposase C of IS166 homeodomain/zinc-finger binding domain of transposase IS66
MDAATLRDLDHLDSEALKALIRALQEQVFSHQKQLTTQQEEILSQREQLASRDAEIEHLKLLIAKLRRLQFGRSSEKRECQIEQLELRLEELEARRTQETAAVKESAPPSTAVVRPVRRPLPDHLPREVRKCLPKQEACPDCGGKLKHLGEDVSEILEYVPASLKVIRYVRPSWLAGVAIASCRPKRRADRSSEALLGQSFWRTCWYRNTVTTCLSIVSRRSLLVPAWSWIAPPWRSGSADPAGCSRRWWKRCDVT